MVDLAQGMDVARVRDLAGRLSSQAGELSRTVQTARDAVNALGSAWSGPDAALLQRHAPSMLAPGFDDSALPPDLDARALHALLGGCPRDIRLYLSDSKAEISMVRDAAGRLRGGADIEDLLNDPLGGAESAHCLFLVRRDPDADVGSTGSDDAVLTTSDPTASELAHRVAKVTDRVAR